MADKQSDINTPTLIVLLGPTGVGKTELSLRMAEAFGCDIVSSDSRQIFREMKIGTAAPTEAELQRVRHHFIATQSIFDSYSAGQYEADALALLEQLFLTHPVQMLVGGSMMYIDALCKGMDDIPHVTPTLRANLRAEYEEKGLTWLQDALRKHDPIHFNRVDKQNHQRMLHALEVCIETGKPYSSFCTGQKKKRPFSIVKIGLNSGPLFILGVVHRVVSVPGLNVMAVPDQIVKISPVFQFTVAIVFQTGINFDLIFVFLPHTPDLFQVIRHTLFLHAITQIKGSKAVIGDTDGQHILADGPLHHLLNGMLSIGEDCVGVQI